MFQHDVASARNPAYMGSPDRPSESLQARRIAPQDGPTGFRNFKKGVKEASVSRGCTVKRSKLPNPNTSRIFSEEVLYVLLLPRCSNFCGYPINAFVYWVFVKLERVKGIEPSFRSDLYLNSVRKFRDLRIQNVL